MYSDDRCVDVDTDVDVDVDHTVHWWLNASGTEVAGAANKVASRKGRRVEQGRVCFAVTVRRCKVE